MIYLMDVLNQQGEDLRSSLMQTHTDMKTVVIMYDGHLPQGVLSPYAHYIYGDAKLEKHPLFFNRLPVPDLWEIRSTNASGEIYDNQKLRGRLYYTTPKNKRMIRVVDWLDEKGVVRFCDHYDQYGHRYSRSHMDDQGKQVYRSYMI